MTGRQKGARVRDVWRGTADGPSEVALQMRGLDDVVRYYEHTRFDYWAVWQTRENLAFHFGYYDDRVGSHGQAVSNSNSVLADIADVGPGERVLDAGCGLGGSSMWLAARRRAEVVGITPVAHQVREARRIAAARGLQDKASFEQGDYTATPFADASFDVVWALESLCHARHKLAFYREAFRLLRPDGRLVIAEYIRKSRALSADTEMRMREWLDGWSIPDLDTREEHIAAATAAGFAEVRLSDSTHLTRRSLRRLYKLACLATPVDWMLYALSLRSRTQHGNVVASLRQYQLLCGGAWFYGILSGRKPS